MAQTGTKMAAFKQALPLSFPIMAGFVFLGITCGMYSSSLGLPWWMPTFMSITIFGGSAEFVVASMLPGAFDPLTTFAVILVVQARHLFYGLSMLWPFRGMGRKKPYLIYALCDESFSINYGARIPADIDRGWFMLFVSLLNQSSWVLGCTLGGVFGSMIPLDIEGISFAMTALFVVIFLDQWLQEKSHVSSLTGLAASAAALAIFGADSFLIPAMIGILVVVTVLRPKLEGVYANGDRTAQAPAHNENGGDEA